MPVSRHSAEPPVPCPKSAILRGSIREDGLSGKGNDLLNAGALVTLVWHQHVWEFMMNAPTILVPATETTDENEDLFAVLTNACPIAAANAFQRVAAYGAESLSVTPDKKPAAICE